MRLTHMPPPVSAVRSWLSCLLGLSVVGPGGLEKVRSSTTLTSGLDGQVPLPSSIFLVRQPVLLRKCEPLEPVQPSARTYPHPGVRGDDSDGPAGGLLEELDPI